MTVRANKPAFSIREKLKELDGKQDKLLNRPAFSCASSGTYTTTTGSQNLASFCGAIVNFDYGGNLTNGRFTAPWSGLYHFDLKFSCSYSSGYLYSYVFKNGGGIPNVFVQYFQTSNTCTLSFRVYANAGDYFEPYIDNNYAGGTISQALFEGHYIG